MVPLFHTPTGEPFLEVHHIRRLSDGGPDDPLSLAGVCPNCHRQAHHGDASEEFNRSLANGVASREVELAHAGEGTSGTRQALGGDAWACPRLARRYGPGHAAFA